MTTAITAFDAGYLIGLLVGPPLVAFAGMWLWGALRHDGPGRARAGLRHAMSLTTLSVAGFLYLASMIGRMSGG